MPSLFDPIKLGAALCPNRVIMAPLTRGRATREHVPTELMQHLLRAARRRRA
jgi:N-ethylmaleimide reductase